MKNVRILYKKTNRMRFMSHLDITRYMARALRRANLPVWYTEGFNPHPYITFALPLPLGFESDYEVMDIRLTDDDFNISPIPSLLNSVTGEDIDFYDCFEPVKKAGSVTSALYKITFDDSGELKDQLSAFLKAKPLVIRKKTKRGEEKEIDISGKIADLSLEINQNTELSLSLPAGGALNINPENLLNAFFEQAQKYYCYTVRKISVLDENHLPFA